MVGRRTARSRRGGPGATVDFGVLVEDRADSLEVGNDCVYFFLVDVECFEERDRALLLLLLAAPRPFRRASALLLLLPITRLQPRPQILTSQRQRPCRQHRCLVEEAHGVSKRIVDVSVGDPHQRLIVDANSQPVCSEEQILLRLRHDQVEAERFEESLLVAEDGGAKGCFLWA